MYILKLNGKSHEVTTVNGKTYYNPPLPEKSTDKWEANIKDICKTRKAPGSLGDDTSFHAGRGTLLQQMDGDQLYCDHLVREAKKQGYTPGDNHVYLGQVADKDGDPKAWFAPGEGRAELKKRLIESGKGCDMPGLTVQAKPYEEKPSKPISDRIATGLAQQYRKSGEADGMSNQQLEKHIIKKHSLKKKHA